MDIFVADFFRRLMRGTINGIDAAIDQQCISPVRREKSCFPTTDNPSIALDCTPDRNHARGVSKVALAVEVHYVPQSDD
jgi:hypothetical protein